MIDDRLAADARHGGGGGLRLALTFNFRVLACSAAVR
jgi:hypothetical protein